jgi:hypothetical protein
VFILKGTFVSQSLTPNIVYEWMAPIPHIRKILDPEASFLTAAVEVTGIFSLARTVVG